MEHPKSAQTEQPPASGNTDPSRLFSGALDGPVARQVAEASPSAICVIDWNGVIKFWNPAAERITGWSSEEVLGRPTPVEFTDNELFLELTARIQEGVRVNGFELPLRTKAGADVVHSVSVGYWGAPGNPESVIICISEDITARVTAERTLVLLKAAIKRIDDGIVIAETKASGEFDVLFENESFRRLTGSHAAAIPPGILSLLRNAGSSGAVIKQRGLDHQERWLEFKSRRSLGPTGEQIIALVCDVSERQSAVEALQQSESRLHAVVHKLDEVFTLLDPAGVIHYQSDSVEQVIGYTPEELLQRSAFDFIAEDQHEAGRQWLAAIASSSKPQPNIHLRVRTKRGEWIWIEAAATNLLNDQSVRRIVVNWRDVTKTRELEHSQISREKMASLGTLSSGVSHEINNPLTYILANIDFALRSLDAPGERKNVLEALKEAGEGARRVRDIVAALQQFAGASDARGAPADLNQVVGSTLRLLRLEILPRATLLTELGEIPKVALNEARLSQLVLNLLVNAAQAVESSTEKGPHEISVTTGIDQGAVVLEVSDTGIGLPPGNVNQVFEPFFRGSTAWSGRGLGLSICHGIATSAGGTISVKRRERGTSFLVRIPAATESMLQEAPLRSGEFTGKKALIVDDEPSIGAALRRMLSGTLEADYVESPAEALTLLRSGAIYDFVLCDLVMPGMSGVELYEELSPEIQDRFVFISGVGTEGALTQAVEKTGRPFLMKPFTLAGLLQSMGLSHTASEDQSG